VAAGLIVSKVLPGSIGAKMEIEAGDIILEVNGCPVQDILDLQYHTADGEFNLGIEKNRTQEIWELEISREPGEILGIEVEGVSRDGVKKCSNHCVFCFVRQMPPGMRASLYDRDDDYRLSFTQGSYITLSNLTDADFQRIIDLHLSPLYISVHAWDPAVRRRLMKNRQVENLSAQIKRLTENGIVLHTQIVLVPGYNDGAVLEETVINLTALYPMIQSIGVVPVGLTKYRKGLPAIRTVSPQEAEQVLSVGESWQKKLKERTGKNLVYFSDEFYVLSGREFPPAAAYDGFPQLENGVGLTAKLIEEIEPLLARLPAEIPPRKVHLVTGVLAADFFRRLGEKLAGIKGLELRVHEIINHFFGPKVTVAGLLTAQDINAQLGDLRGDYFLIPRVMLKADEDVFLDDRSVQWLQENVNGKAIIVNPNGRDLLEGILGSVLEVGLDG